MGCDPVTLGAPTEQCLDQNTRSWNAPTQQLSLAEQMVDGSSHERYRTIAISTPSPLPRQVHVNDLQFAEVVSPAYKDIADLGQNVMSTVTIRTRLAVHQRNGQRSPDEGHRQVITGSFRNP